MKQPVNFTNLDGKYIESKGHEFYIECNTFGQVWLFPTCEPDFDNCILLTYDWPNGLFNVRICELGNGTLGHDAAINRAILKEDVLSIDSYLKKLKKITEIYFDKIIKK